MNQRSTKIVQLLSKEKDEITVSGFAEYFQVSQKTIRNDMKEINEILEKNKRGIIDIKSGGIVSIPADFKDSLSLLLEGNFYNYKLSKEERKKSCISDHCQFGRLYYAGINCRQIDGKQGNGDQ